MPSPRHVLSLDLAQKLHEAGFRIESEYYWGRKWRKDCKNQEWELHNFSGCEDCSTQYKENIPAPLASELMEALPGEMPGDTGSVLNLIKLEPADIVRYSCRYANDEDMSVIVSFQADTAVDSLGQTLLHLIANKLIEVGK